MRKIVTTTFITMDGVMQAPGGPTEDPSGNFLYGGWSAYYWDDLMGKVMDGFLNTPFELLLGKNTYDIFAACWPTAKQDLNVAQKFNPAKKYVVSHTRQELSWANSTIIFGDTVTELKKLKNQDGPDLWVHGSGNLIQTLLAHNLIDVMHIWTFPVTVGKGKRLFDEGTQPAGFKLLDSKISTTGVIIASYAPAGALKTGTIGT